MESHVTIKIAFKEYLMPIKMLQYVMGKGEAMQTYLTFTLSPY